MRPLLWAAALAAAAGAGVPYRAAVVELAPVDGSHVQTPSDAHAVLMQNAEVLDHWAGEAAAQGAQIVVFPEDYLSSGDTLTRETGHLMAELLPDVGAQLCDPSAAAAGAPAASAVACAARRHGLIVVTGLATFAPCATHVNPFTKQAYPCNRTSGLAPFNSMAAFGRDGQLLAKYHKAHLANAWDMQWEVQWAEADAPEVVTFDSHFGVRFGMFICNDVNFGGPTWSLLQAGVRDFVFSTDWINEDPWELAISMQDAFARTHGVNFIAANDEADGRFSSGSGIWPADSSAPFVQYFNAGTKPQGGWMGVLDLVSPEASVPLPQAVSHPPGGAALGDPGTTAVAWFTARSGQSLQLAARAANVSCELEASVERGARGSYALLATAGLESGGWYAARCVVVYCRHPGNLTACSAQALKGKSLRKGGAVFERLQVSMAAPHPNVFFPNALCDGLVVPTPRSILQMRTDPQTGAQVMALQAPPCKLAVAVIDGRAQRESEAPECPPGLCLAEREAPVMPVVVYV